MEKSAVAAKRNGLCPSENSPLLLKRINQLWFVVMSILFAVNENSVCSVNAFTSYNSNFHHDRTTLSNFYDRISSGSRKSCSKSILPSRSSPSSSFPSVSLVTLQATHPNQIDLNVEFGSSSGDDDDFEEDDLEDEKNRNRLQRQQKIQRLLAEQDKSFKEERKRKQWGKYANVTSKEELEPILQEEKKEIDRENQLKKDIAARNGVLIEMLEPVDEDKWEEKGTLRSKAEKGKNWFEEEDDDLKSEWEELMSGKKKEKDDDSPEKDTSGSSSTAEKSGNDLGLSNDIQLKDGKVVSKYRMQGVRVGSAGGWTLEVFPGDFVVHRKYGIGKFERTCLRPKKRLSELEISQQRARRVELLEEELSKLKHGATKNDIQAIQAKFGTEEDKDPISNPQITVFELSYADAVVHVPVDRAYRLSRYRSGDSIVKPRLSRVKGETWAKAKKKVEENTVQLAQDVLALYSKRETLVRTPGSPVNEIKYKEIEKSFAFDPTSDQKKCFEDVENDMVWRNRPMDRLVCGDVGFGKTEVAIRALYRAFCNGKQSALLAPTGVLASQHFRNIVKRMGEETPFNVNCALLRGGAKNSKAGRELREKIASGEARLIVGTHALLSSDMQFKDLGLLVVDEEQRFGVKQKERLKLIANGVDVLTLSATPIPRTLQMSLSGIRDTSTIRSPPPMRKPTITYVTDFAEDVVREAISTELERGGQCYYVVPRISQLDEAEETILKLFPDLRIIQAHGRMQKHGAEANVALFAEGKYDILLATTVIENGVDIPSVNTIIIQNSQNFGMSTLYQLRGRVGRSNLQAYAYFLHQEESLTEQASMRLQAIGDLNELGSGFDVANRDLEIRGAGSLLGTEQSGMAAKVGFDLYMRMLKKSIRKLRGLDLPLVPRTNMLMLDKDSYQGLLIPDSYVPDENTRLTEEGKARLAETNNKLVAVTNGWKETYGPLPASLQQQIKRVHLHICTKRLGIDIVGFAEVNNFEDNSISEACVLRSPGLRPRHLSIIVPMLKNGALPKGLNVLFPPRFTLAGVDEEEIAGGEKIDLRKMLEDESLNPDNDDDNWDEMDEEEVEDMKQISSAYSIKSIDEVDLENYPRFILKNAKNDKSIVDQLLKVLLPVSKIVHQVQERNVDEAKIASQLRKKSSLLKDRKKKSESLIANRMRYQNS